MTDMVWIVLIIAVLVGVLFVFRKQDISKLNVQAGKVKAGVETREAGAITIEGFKQKGRGNTTHIHRGSVHIKNTEQEGDFHEINIQPDQSKD